MRWCPSCKKEFADEVNFCKFCGAKLEEKIIEEKKTEKEEEKAISSEEKEKEEVCIEPSREKDASFYKKMLLVAGIVIVLLAAVLLFHGGKQENDESAGIGTEEQSNEEEVRDNSDAEQNMEGLHADGKDGFWVNTPKGNSFYLPEGFTERRSGENLENGYYYDFCNEELQMYLNIVEVPFSSVDEDRTPQEIMKDEYYQSLHIYGDLVGYSVERDDFCVCSANDEYDIYYTKFINLDDEVYLVLDFLYPVENRAVCDKILEEILDSLVFY